MEALNEADPGYISVVVMVELVWVLDRSYRLADREIAAVIETLLQVPVVTVENEQEVFTAMTALKEGWEPFAGMLISELGASAGCSRTLTFDRKASGLPGFQLVI